MIFRKARLALVMLCAAAPAAAQDFVLSSPIACDLGRDCYIQQYVDHDPSSGAHDFRCGSLSYNRHDGTDFAVPTLARAAEGVAVLAAAPGRVAAVRDGQPDRFYSAGNAEYVSGRECGNGVRIVHGDGWETQYCHLRKGSITVREGQSVGRNQKLGLVGLSGRTQFPHVHLSVRRNGESIDPFAPDPARACGAPQPRNLWADAPPYRPGGLLDIGFSAEVPRFDAVKAGRAQERLTRESPAIVAFGYAFGGRSGDVLRIEIRTPKGLLIDHQARIEKDQAQFFRAAGKKRPEDGWPRGDYKARISLLRGGQTIDGREARITLP